jgi:hypothetical protein
MLAELAAANAAFAVIKQTIANGKEIYDAGNAASSYFDNKNKIQRKLNSKGNRSDIEEFFALEKLKEQEQELQQLMIYAGRPGLWDDWLKFQSDAKRERDRKELLRQKAAIERAAQLKQLAMIFTVGLFVVSSMVGGLFIALL